VTGQQRILTPPRHLILPWRLSEGSCCPTLDFVIAFWIITTFYTLLTSLFCITTGKLRNLWPNQSIQIFSVYTIAGVTEVFWPGWSFFNVEYWDQERWIEKLAVSWKFDNKTGSKPYTYSKFHSNLCIYSVYSVWVGVWLWFWVWIRNINSKRLIISWPGVLLVNFQKSWYSKYYNDQKEP
jgi:hypothetical protein